MDLHLQLIWAQLQFNHCKSNWFVCGTELNLIIFFFGESPITICYQDLLIQDQDQDMMSQEVCYK